MIRSNFLLLLIAVLCALATVHANHQARRLFTELEREQGRMQALEDEWGRLQLEQSTYATHSRIEKMAREKLGMHPPQPARTLVID